jgi:phosphoenolpyruvate carboxylase
MNNFWEYSIEFWSDPLCHISKLYKKVKTEHLWPSDEAEEYYFDIDTLNERMNEMALNLDALKEEVTRVATVHESAIKFIAAVTEELKVVSAELKAKHEEVIDTSELDELVAKLDASTDALAAAIAVSQDNPVVEEEEVKVDEPLNTDNATTPETGGAPVEGMEGTQSGPEVEGAPV